MYYSEIFFKKDIYDIVEQDVIDFFNEEQEESSILEFKSGDVSLEKIYREVAALHNTQGGLIIVGSPRPSKDINGKEYFTGELTNSIHKHKDWLYQKISSQISPSPALLKIHDVKTKGGIIQIIDIPKSSTPPHQCIGNGVYYLRFETETKHAPHGLVEALFNRRQEPKVECDIINFNFQESSMVCELSLSFTNTSKIPLIGVHHVVSFDNVTNCEYRGYQGNWTGMEYKINPSGNLSVASRTVNDSKSVIVEGIKNYYEYRIDQMIPFKIHVAVWGSNMNLLNFFFIVSPKDKAFRKLSMKENSAKQFTYEINEIIEKAEIEDRSIDKRGLLDLSAKLSKENIIN